MARYMVTHSLLSSWLYLMRENPYEDATSEKDAYADFMTVLRREPTETTTAMQYGNDFEALVTAILLKTPSAAFHKEDWRTKEIREEWYQTEKHPWYSAAATIAGEISGHLLQLKASKMAEINGMKILLYGRLDALGAGMITDIKFSKKYERGKYFDSTQHPMYFELVPGAETFTYAVSNGDLVWHETYRRDETRSIVPIVAAFLDWLTASGNMETYKQYWAAAS